MKYIIYIFLLVSIASCRSSKQIEVVEKVKTDTLYRSNIKYDSIYIQNDHFVDPVNSNIRRDQAH